MTEHESIININLDLLVPNKYQPRKVFNDVSISELAESIKEYGILNPILVRKQGEKYEIIAGERRVRAAKIAGLTTIPAIVKEVEDTKMAELALIENIQRENITPIEEAMSYEQILDTTDITEEKLSKMIGKSQSIIANKMRLLTLPKEIQDAVINKQISEKHARVLQSEENKEKQKELLKKIIAEKISVKELENIMYEKKEEKESDNMNNGNFFPNFNANGGQNNNINTNTIDLPTQPGTPPAVEITPMTYNPQEAVNEEPQVLQTQVSKEQVPIEQPTISQEPLSVNNMQPTMPSEIEPVIEVPIQKSIPDTIDMRPEETELPLQENKSINDIPLFTSQNNQESIPDIQIEENQEQNNVTEDFSAPEPLLFPTNDNQENTTPEEIQVPIDNNYNFPTVDEPDDDEDDADEDDDDDEYEEYGTKEVNQYYKVKNFLEDNDIPYKAYTNETNNCIIIEF